MVRDQVQAMGIMSGSSLDGLDISIANYNLRDSHWEHQLLAAETFSFPSEILKGLKNCRTLSGLELAKLDNTLGYWIGEKCNFLIQQSGADPDIIGSHGHTVFHDVKEKLTVQIGNGQIISSLTKIPTYCDFRSKDIFYGGQGAPFAPIGDYHLFPDFDSFLNLGGIANISNREEGGFKAWDICPLNQVLNLLSSRIGLEFDDRGSISKKGSLKRDWLEDWGKPAFYAENPPKAMSNEWVKSEVIDNLPSGNTEDLLHSFTVFAAHQIAEALKISKAEKVLASGGGAKNDFLMNLIRKDCPHIEIVKPNEEIISFKESLFFGLMAVLRLNDQVNTFKSVTGASRDVSSGAVYTP